MDKEHLDEKMMRLFKAVFNYLANDVVRQRGRLHAPSYKNSRGYRLGEQELKSAFVEQFLFSDDFKDYSYSLEAPTENRYQFSQYGEAIEPVCCETGGRTASLDIVLFKGNDRVAILEMRANGAGDHEHAKDLIKLSKEPGENLARWYVDFFRNSDNGTLEGIKQKLYRNRYGNIASNTHFLGMSLNHNLGEQVLFTFVESGGTYECVYL